MITDYPQTKCQNCKKNLWWYNGSSWTCGICSPPASDLDKIRMRVVAGNYKLTKLWMVARPEFSRFETPEEHALTAQFKQAMETMKEVGKQLKALSTDCVYVEKGKKMKSCMASFGKLTCFTCPNDYWWLQELYDRQAMEKFIDETPKEKVNERD